MIFHTQEALFGLMIASLPTFLSVYLFFVLKKERLALFSLFLSAILLRLLIISLDPFLQDWDERFHALVAKNMILHPFTPMLRVTPIMVYDPAAWCCNHIWVHKQPLFLWQMAASMKLFGVNVIALRLPSALMGAGSVFLTYEIARHWTKNASVAFLSALILAFSFYQLELTSGRFSLEHNDVGFMFYITAAIWAFVKYIKSNYSIKWALLIGVLVGCAVLVKWLTALVIFGGWGLYILQQQSTRFSMRHYGHLGLSLLTSCLVFLPWQLYILNEFPIESAFSYTHNMQHITEVLGGHVGDAWFHLNMMRTTYGQFLLPFVLIGSISLINGKSIDRNLSLSFYSMIIVVYAFFSIVVATKMPALTYLVNSLVIILIAQGIITSYEFVAFRISVLKNRNSPYYLPLLILGIAIYSLKPWNISQHRSSANDARSIKINNTQAYQSLDDTICQNYIVLNCKSFEDVELMFHKNVNAYHWFPPESVIDSLENLGHKFAAFQSHSNQGLPGYMLNNNNILIIEKALK